MRIYSDEEIAAINQWIRERELEIAQRPEGGAVTALALMGFFGEECRIAAEKPKP